MPHRFHDNLTHPFKSRISYIKHETEKDCLPHFPLIIKQKEDTIRAPGRFRFSVRTPAFFISPCQNDTSTGITRLLTASFRVSTRVTGKKHGVTVTVIRRETACLPGVCIESFLQMISPGMHEQNGFSASHFLHSPL